MNDKNYRLRFSMIAIFRQLFLLSLAIILLSKCKKEGPKAAITLPQVSTMSLSSITPTTATAGGTIISDGGAPVSERGVCWGTVQGPTTNDSKTSDGNGTGNFTSNISGLQPNTTYYIRAYAINTVGTNYGSTIAFTTAKSISANFTMSKSIVYQGESIQFTNASTGPFTSSSWVIQGGTPPVSNDRNPLVKFNFAGTFTAALTITDGTETDTKTLTITSQPFTVSISPKRLVLSQNESYSFVMTYPEAPTQIYFHPSVTRLIYTSLDLQIPIVVPVSRLINQGRYC